MTADGIAPEPSGASGGSVQEYIDETPTWADATAVIAAWTKLPTGQR